MISVLVGIGLIVLFISFGHTAATEDLFDEPFWKIWVVYFCIYCFPFFGIYLIITGV